MTDQRVTFRDIPCDVFSPDCPSRAVLALLAEKWTILILHALGDGPQRPGALRKRIGGISEKMLIQTLRRLEGAGLILRKSHDEVPPRVDYSLSELGWSLSPLVRALDQWAEQHAEIIATASTGQP